jgi:hypothetical protein
MMPPPTISMRPGRVAQFQRAGGVDDARVVREERQAHGLRAGRDDGLLELDRLRVARLLLAFAAGLVDLDVERVDEVAVAAHDRDLAHLGHRAQAAGELAHHLALVRAQLGDVELRFAVGHAQVGEVLDLVHHHRHVQQRLRRDAAHVEADAAERGVALDQHHLHAEVGGAERGRIAAGAAAEHEQVALDVGAAGVRRRDGRRARVRGRRCGGRARGRGRRGRRAPAQAWRRRHRPPPASASPSPC